MTYLNLRCTVAAETSCGVAVEQSGQQVPGRRRYHVGPREMERLGEDFAVHLIRVLVVEWRQTRQHLVQQHTQSPPIDSLGVALSVQELRCKVFGCTAECVGLIFVLHVQLAQAEVTKCDVADVIDKDVLWLQVTVDDTESMQALESTQKFRSVETRSVDVEALLLLEVVEKLAAVDE